MSPLPEYVLATLTPYPSLWCFAASEQDAANQAEDANRYWKHISETQGTPERNYQPMTYADYVEAECQFYLSRPLEEITAEKYDEMLNVLPPKKWHTTGGLQRFLMSEHWSGPYTSQYATIDGRFFTRVVDAGDESTWITRDEINSFLAGQPQTAWQRRVSESQQSNLER
jgi:hypothetical protein